MGGNPLGGSAVGGEALRLLHAVQDWAGDWPRDSLGAGSAPDAGRCWCRYCPLCRLVSVLRGEQPEVTEKLAEAGTALLAALRGALDFALAGASAADPVPDPAARVQRIDID